VYEGKMGVVMKQQGMVREKVVVEVGQLQQQDQG
jgi:hypothetical protein